MKDTLIKKVLPVLAVILVAVAIAVIFKLMSPKPEIKTPEGVATLVEVTEAKRKTDRVEIEAMGTVMPSRKVDINPQVSGKVVEINSDLVPGGHVEEGEVLFRIEDGDYRAALSQARAQVEEARSSLKLEQGQQDVARSEWKLMHGGEPPETAGADLALRKPQLASAKARLSSAKASLDKAELNLERTVIRAPFNATITRKNVDVGQFVSQQTVMAGLAGSDSYWVEVSLQVNRLPWIELPDRTTGEGGASAVVSYNTSGKTLVEMPGRVIKLIEQMDPKSRLARLLIEVQDPLRLGEEGGSKGVPLMLNSYVRVDILGKTIEDAFVVPRVALREGDKVWIMTPDDTLEVREIDVAWRKENEILVTGGLEDGERIVTSRIASAVPGMKLTLRSARSDEGRELNTNKGPAKDSPKKTAELD